MDANQWQYAAQQKAGGDGLETRNRLSAQRLGPLLRTDAAVPAGDGAPDNPLPPESWREWDRNQVTYGKRTTLASGPIFLHEMAQAFYNFRGKRDVLGYSYWVSSEQAVQINRQYCLDLANAGKRRGYAADIWGLNACDGPDGYKAYGAPPSEEDGTVSPTGAIAALLFAPDLARSAADAMYARYGDKIWGRYGFSNGFNPDRNWYDQDVIGIDLGMALLAIEDVQTGLPWKLLASHPATQRALKAAGFHPSSDNTHLRRPVKPSSAVEIEGSRE